MKNLFNASDTDEIILRIEGISPDAQRQWGKMELPQMLAHCGNVLEMAVGNINPDRQLIGRLIGGFLKFKYTEEKPFSKGDPTDVHVKVTDVRNFKVEKERLMRLVKQFSAGREINCTRHPHPFFGDLTPADWSRGMYKHLDHHLRQFGG